MNRERAISLFLLAAALGATVVAIRQCRRVSVLERSDDARSKYCTTRVRTLDALDLSVQQALRLGASEDDIEIGKRAAEEFTHLSYDASELELCAESSSVRGLSEMRKCWAMTASPKCVEESLSDERQAMRRWRAPLSK